MTNSRIPLIAWLAFLSSICVTAFVREPSRVEPSLPVVQTTYYEVSGSNVAELVASIDRCRPIERDGQTDWNIKWRYWYEPSFDGYVITSFAADVEIGYTMPKWVDQDQADPAVSQEWQRYVDCLDVHEQLHGQIALDCGAAMEQHFKLNAVGAEHLQELGDVVDSVCFSFIAEYNAKNVAYDQETDHGRTQGARRDFSHIGDHKSNKRKTTTARSKGVVKPLAIN